MEIGFKKPFVVHHRELLVDIIRQNVANVCIGAEVGVDRGVSSEYLFKGFPNLILFCIDRWIDFSCNKEYLNTGDNKANRSQENANRDYIEAIERTLSFDRLCIMRMDFVKAAGLILDKLFDFVFLDADHSYNGTLNALVCYWPKIKDGGLLIGHDYGGFKVAQAVNEFMKRQNISKERLKIGGQTLFWINKTDVTN